MSQDQGNRQLIFFVIMVMQSVTHTNRKKTVSKLPLVSIVLPVKNGADFLVEAIESIIAQTYTHWELIVVNDGSIDRTREILVYYAEKYPQISVRTLRKSVGISKALNLGIAKAKGAFIARMDADDISYPARLTKQIAYLIDNPHVVAVGSQCDVINELGELTGMKVFPTSHKDIYNTVFRFNPLQHPTLMINRALVPMNYVFYDNLDGAEDLGLLFKLFPYGKVHNMPEALLAYRIHSHNTSLHNIKTIYLQALRARIRGVMHYKYIPTITSICITIAQTMLVVMLPSPAIRRLYMYTRGISSSLPGFVKSKVSAYPVK